MSTPPLRQLIGPLGSGVGVVAPGVVNTVVVGGGTENILNVIVKTIIMTKVQSNKIPDDVYICRSVFMPALCTRLKPKLSVKNLQIHANSKSRRKGLP